MIAELTIRYDHNLRPVSSECSTCGQHMPPPPRVLHDSGDILVWFSGQFIEHRKQKHPSPPYGAASPGRPGA